MGQPSTEGRCWTTGKQLEYDFIKKIQEGTLDVIDWLAAQDEDTIRNRVYERVPEDIDTSVGSYEYDAIEPTNTEFAVVYFMLRNTILLAFPQYSFGQWLTLAAAAKGVYRKAATYADGKLLVTGAAGTEIPAGTKFSNTILEGSALPVKYYTSQKPGIIGVDGSIELTISADSTGTAGNADVNEINLNITDISNITSINNVLAITNGADEESDESLLNRLLDKVRNPTSGGNKNDYKQWAKEVPGVAEAEVIPLWDGPGTVQVVIIGEGGMPVPDLVEKVKEHLDPADHAGEGEGRAPIGAIVSVVTTENYIIRIGLNGLEFEDGYSLSTTRQVMIEAVKEEVAKVKIGGLVRIHYIEDAIKHVPGIKDFGEVLLDGGSRNIQIPPHLKPIAGEVCFDGD